MSRSWNLCSSGIVESAKRVRRYTQELDLESFVKNEMVYDAVVRNLETIGEAAKKTPPEIRGRYPQVAWRRIAGLRDVLAHAYFGLDDETLWKIVQEKVPQLVLVLGEMSYRHDAEVK